MLENVEIVLQLYDQVGREGGKEEERGNMTEKVKRSRVIFGLRGEWGGARRFDVKNHLPPSRLNGVARNSHVGDR